ncbi:hypothetical protein JL100_029605 [Skermanella mucosa]|uniref:hypothetical protein n=1 Tax=Skermanella mucosa TaxID=1789672 RepID=UPI00192BD6E4|nr:hypothetical protein [Skermanella mucosa]UEM21170.1 hypothetical protein JL100_029605 [Skermanella mucosa]
MLDPAEQLLVGRLKRVLDQAPVALQAGNAGLHAGNLAAQFTDLDVDCRDLVQQSRQQIPCFLNHQPSPSYPR